MRQIAILLATAVALAVPGAASAQRAHGQGIAAHHASGDHHLRRGGRLWGVGWPLMMAAPPAPEGGEFVTHEFIDPRAFGPRRPRVDIVSDEPVFLRYPPHIIQLHRVRHRPLITMVRRGVVTQE